MQGYKTAVLWGPLASAGRSFVQVSAWAVKAGVGTRRVTFDRAFANEPMPVDPFEDVGQYPGAARSE